MSRGILVLGLIAVLSNAGVAAERTIKCSYANNWVWGSLLVEEKADKINVAVSADPAMRTWESLLKTNLSGTWSYLYGVSFTYPITKKCQLPTGDANHYLLECVAPLTEAVPVTFLDEYGNPIESQSFPVDFKLTWDTVSAVDKNSSGTFLVADIALWGQSAVKVKQERVLFSPNDCSLQE